jgi:hypothetical protein
MQYFRTFHTAERAIKGNEAMHAMRKGQVKRLGVRNSAGQAKFIASLFVVTAKRCGAPRPYMPEINLCN